MGSHPSTMTNTHKNKGDAVLNELLLLFWRAAAQLCAHRAVLLPVGADEGQSTRGDVDSEVRTVAAITSLSA